MRNGFLAALLIAAFLLPVALYVSKFGVGLWSEHTKWAELGSFLSGIYSPLIAFLALVILVRQWRAQKSMDLYNVHMSVVANNSRNIDYFLNKLEASLVSDYDENETLEAHLRKCLDGIGKNNLIAHVANPIYDLSDSKFKRILSYWVALTSQLQQLRTQNGVVFQGTLATEKVKIVAIISAKTCVALDKYYFAVSKLARDYEFDFWNPKT